MILDEYGNVVLLEPTPCGYRGCPEWSTVRYTSIRMTLPWYRCAHHAPGAKLALDVGSSQADPVDSTDMPAPNPAGG